MIQGGDPNGDGTGGPGYFVDEPPPQDLTYTKATVAMAKTEAEPPGRSGSQFFVVTAPADAGLPPDYALLGTRHRGLRDDRGDRGAGGLDHGPGGDREHHLGERLMAKLAVGQPAPAFELPGTGGRSYRLSDYEETGVILAFYPGDFTPVCTKQFCSYRDDGDRIEALGMPMLGISPQSVESPRALQPRRTA